MARLDYTSLKEALDDIFAPENSPVTNRKKLGGGCINKAELLTLKNGRQVFIKQNAEPDPVFFRAESRGLDALRTGSSLRTPDVLGSGNLNGDGEGGGSFLLLEAVTSHPKSPDFWKTFGSSLAEMHKRDGAELFGFSEDNFIGDSAQINFRKKSWKDFFSQCRIAPQLRMARETGRMDADLEKQIEGILNRIDDYFTEPEHASLIHGDLWSGNYLSDERGLPVLIDPAVSYSHREADLAMTELFGGFHKSFYEAYNEVYPVEPGYPGRRDLYNLYHMLNHMNLFGTSYEGSVRAIVRNYM